MFFLLRRLAALSAFNFAGKNIDEMSAALEKLTEVVDGGLTRLQSGLLGLLVKSGLDNHSQNAIMILIKEDVHAQIDLLLWLYYKNPTGEEIMNKWVRGYLIAHKEAIEAENQ